MGAATEHCGFFGTSAIISAADLRTEIRDAAVAERALWFTPGHTAGDGDDPQFGHLVRYWLAIQDTIRPPTLTHLSTQALSPAIVYGALLDRTVTPDTAAAVATALAARLLAGAPAVGGPADVQQRVANALLAAWRTRLPVDPWQWSAACVNTVIRGVAVRRGLEAESGGAHVGPNVLLKSGMGHRHYVKEAHRRRTSTPPVTGTYQAFRPGEAPVEVGDIVVGDRMASNPTEVVDFDGIPGISDERYDMHGDIVVAVTSDYAEAIGGNIGYSDPDPADVCTQPASRDPFNVRRRRYPLTAGGNLVVDPDQRYVQENNDGHMPPLPVVCPISPGGFHQRSMGRMFVVLKLVEQCETA